MVIKSLAIQALESGATKNEIMETLRIVNFICGVGSMYASAVALKIYSRILYAEDHFKCERL